MRAFHWLLLASLWLGAAQAEPLRSTQDQRVGEGLMLMLKGEKQRAWEILFPEAKAGNVIAMYHLGVMMTRSPEYADHLQRARKFFSAAAERGHKGSAAMLDQVNGLLARAGEIPGIAGSSGVPLPSDLAAAKEAYAKAQNQVGRFVGALPSSLPQVTVKAFVTENAASMQNLIVAAQEAKARFGDKVSFQFYVVIDQRQWNPRTVFTASTGSMPITGFRPDLNGEEAAKYGVRTMPAIVFIPERGQPRILASVKDVISEVSSVLR